jgi:hypothetical protein
VGRRVATLAPPHKIRPTISRPNTKLRSQIALTGTASDVPRRTILNWHGNPGTANRPSNLGALFCPAILVRRKWRDDKTQDNVDLVGLCQFLPGSTCARAVCLRVAEIETALGSGWLHGLKVAVVAVVAQAVLWMMRSLARGGISHHD